ncbi:amidohydrolase [Neptunicoccus cionae]|uniref:Amidohydrolase n=1 Tax=Neptunicoccus cionae TaxID=2035344 RepID=A0A916R072_9RHOB|nr:amidohydrolase [Amylibacter cionae]GGA27549.1 amidohydrolase [Amylibacter cionae]
MQKADTVFLGGNILTLNPSQPHAEAIAVAKGHVLACGSDQDIDAFVGPQTRKVSFGGRFVMPGLIESHTHALWGACRDLFEVYVGYTATSQTLAQAIRNRAESTAKGLWISGGPWRYEMRDELGMSPRDWLDTLAPAHPVALFDTSQHAVWCNSQALSLCGFDEDSPPIAGGVIERDATGRLSGMLAEAALAPVRGKIKETPEQLREACDYALRYLNSLGYTGFKEPMADERTLAAYAQACDAGRWSLHAAAHITAYSPLSDGNVPLDEINRLRNTYTRDDLRLDYAKLFLDGVAPAHTASFLDPYQPAVGYDPDSHDPDATLLMSPSDLNDKVTELDRHGYVVKMHAVGDNAIRKGLDAIEAARRTNGFSGLRHEIAHSAFVSDADLPRFAVLDAVAEVSPKLWMPNAATPSQKAVLNAEQMNRLHRIRDLLDAGAEVIFATDWPASAPDADPWSGLAGMLNRQDPTKKFSGTMNGAQSVPLDCALDLFTKNAARAIGLGGQTSILREGAFADFIVLNGDIQTLTPAEIGAIEVQETVWKGNTVFAR